MADLEKKKKFKEKNPEKAREYQSRYSQANNENRRSKWWSDPQYREKNKSATARYRANNSEKTREATRLSNRKMRLALLSLYGGRCACCSEDRWEFLAIDHVAGGGNMERRSVGSNKTYRRLLKSGVVDDRYRILCHNCNSSLGNYGYCPHGNLTSYKEIETEDIKNVA